MQTRMSLIYLIPGILMAVTIHFSAYGQNPGESCTPGQSIGYVARFGSVTGSVHLTDSNGNRTPVVQNGIIKEGSTVETLAGSSAVLILEDGTQERYSRLLLNGLSEAVFKRGLYCSDLRPIAEGGRWTSREVGIDLNRGSMSFEIAEPVSYSFDAEIRTKNAVANMMRNRNMVVRVDVEATDGGERELVPVLEHMAIKSYLTGLLFGRSMDDLSPSERHTIQQHAVIAAISMGFLDLESEGYLDHPQAGPMVQMMTRGRSFDELEQQEKEMIAGAVGALLIDSGYINPDEVMIYGEPDERTVFRVHEGRFRIYNSRLGFRSDRVVVSERGTVVQVRGYDLPQPVL